MQKTFNRSLVAVGLLIGAAAANAAAVPMHCLRRALGTPAMRRICQLLVRRLTGPKMPCVQLLPLPWVAPIHRALTPHDLVVLLA